MGAVVQLMVADVPGSARVLTPAVPQSVEQRRQPWAPIPVFHRLFTCAPALGAALLFTAGLGAGPFVGGVAVAVAVAGTIRSPATQN